MVAALRECGVMEAQRAVDKCRAAGASPELALAVVAHFRERPGAWGAGALGWRISRLAAGQDPASGWPTPSPAAHVAQRRAALAAAESRQQREHQAALARRAEDARQTGEREALYGKALDALADDSRDALAQSIGWQPESFAWRQYIASGRGRQAGVVRLRMLEQFGLSASTT